MDRISGEVMNKLSGEERPYVGMGATVSFGSDSEPYTVVEVSPSGKRVEIRRCNYRRIDKRGPFTENQEYEITEDENAPSITAKLRKDGRWSTIGRTPVHLGYRRAYQDPCR